MLLPKGVVIKIFFRSVIWNLEITYFKTFCLFSHSINSPRLITYTFRLSLVLVFSLSSQNWMTRHLHTFYSSLYHLSFCDSSDVNICISFKRFSLEMSSIEINRVSNNNENIKCVSNGQWTEKHKTSDLWSFQCVLILL